MEKNLTVFIDYSNRIARNARPILRRAMDHFGEELTLTVRFFSKKPKNIEFQISSKAALAAELQGKFQEMHELLLFHNGVYNREAVIEYAKDIGLDIRKFRRDLVSDVITHRLEGDMMLARQRKVKFVPGVTINGYVYKGAWDEDDLMEALRNSNNQQMQQAMSSFLQWGASASVVLLVAAIVALIVANTGLINAYEFLRHLKLGFISSIGSFQLPLEVWINDGLMAIFFLLIGLEIKREVLSGELSDMKKASMPIVGAIGGMLLPALFYAGFNLNSSELNGWGIPMATDIAFTLGLMALLGSKVPNALKVFISALAVTDDLGAIIVIALFYSHGFQLNAFLFALLVIGIMSILNYYRVYLKTIYIFLGIILWFFIYQSGLHATLAGVLTAILIPSRRRGNIEGIATQAMVIFQHEIITIKDSDNSNESIRHSSLKLVQKSINRLISPGEQIEYSLERIVNYSILPLFAFFNTGILIAGSHFNIITPANLGIVIGLCIGKPLGIVGFCWLASSLKIASLSPLISWPQLTGAACLAGVGFTMSIVVASSAFHGDVLDGAKLSILIASAISTVVGLIVLWRSVQAKV